MIVNGKCARKMFLTAINKNWLEISKKRFARLYARVRREIKAHSEEVISRILTGHGKFLGV